LRRVKRVKPEQVLAKRVAGYLKRTYPNIPFRFDTGADMRTDMNSAKRNKELHGKWSKGYPDLFICHCKRNKKGRIKYGGLYLELKATKSVPNSEHTRRQAVFHALLREQGYKVHFACGYEESVDLIDKYLST